MKNLKRAYLRVSVETQEQFEACCKAPQVDLIYLDAGFFPPDGWKLLKEKANKGCGGFGKLLGIRLPQIWRERTENWLEQHWTELETTGFDVYLVRNPEEILWLQEKKIKPELIVTDHTVYFFNSLSEETLEEITGVSCGTFTYPLELNGKEIGDLRRRQRIKAAESELVIYGRANLMVTAQCLRKTGIGCDRRNSVTWLKDRTGALMPVKNCCTFCCNTIYNAFPTVLYDLMEELEEIAPEHLRYEFTTESPAAVKDILNGLVPEKLTRGHFKRGVL